MNGTANNDTLLGTNADDVISGLQGNDSIEGLKGNDTLRGDSGNDTLKGGEGNDRLNAGTGINFVDGGVGVDTAVLNYSTLSGSIDHNGYARNYGATYSSELRQYIHYHENVENTILTGTNFDDTVSASGTKDTIDGASGSDRLYLGLFNQTDNLNVNVDLTITNNQITGIDQMRVKRFESLGGIATGSGDDTISLANTDANFGWIDGGDGVDSLNADFSTLNEGINYLDFTEIESIDLKGTDFDDTLNGLNLVDTLDGGLGTDLLNLDLSAETENLNLKVNLKTANNQISANNTPLAISNFERSNIFGGEGEDTIKLDYSTLSGSIYLDTYNQSGYANVFSYSEEQYIHYHSEIEKINITGSTVDDTLKGNDSNDTLKGNTGNDKLSGQSGNDTIDGGAGSDRLVESGNVDYKLTNSKLTGLGTDTIFNVEGVRLQGGNGNNTIDALDVTQMNVTLDGAAGNDSMVSGAKSDVLFGQDGNDTLKGNAGNDQLFGQNQADNLVGGEGNDTLNGGGGYDRITEFGNVDYKLTNSALTGKGTDTIYNVETAYLAGGAGNNTIDAGSATAIKVTLDGAGGNDSMVGGAKSDVLFGKDGNDTLKGGAGSDRLWGGNEDDILAGQSGNDTIDGGAGSDRLVESGNVNYRLSNTKLTGLGTDSLSKIELVRLQGGNGNNIINAIDVTAMNVTLDGAGGNDNLIGGAKSDFLMGRDGNDLIKGRSGDDGVYGQNGNDILAGQSGNDTLNGGGGIDRIIETANVNFTLTDTQLKGLGTDTINSVEQAYLTGGAGNNKINAGQGNNLNVTLAGGAGNDSLYGGAKSDVLYGQDGSDRLESRIGNDVLHGGKGNDALYAGSGNDTVFGNDGNDILRGEGGNDTIDGGAGSDRLIETANVNFTLSDTQLVGMGTDLIRNLEQTRLEGGVGNNKLDAGQVNNLNVTLAGAAGNDSLYGGAKSDVLNGGDGNDRLESRIGNDKLNGGNGNDAMFAGSGNDTLYGGNNNDTIKGEGGDDLINGAAGYDRLVEQGDVNFTLTNTQLMGVGTDTIYNIEVARLQGGAGNNTLDASGATNIQAILFGELGNDTLIGSQMSDNLYGGTGNDVLNGESGNDTLIGNGGADIFVLEAAGIDTIKDFQDGIDKFSLSAPISFSDLSITNNAGGTAVLIADTTNNNELLAVVNGVNADVINSADFTTI